MRIWSGWTTVDNDQNSSTNQLLCPRCNKFMFSIILTSPCKRQSQVSFQVWNPSVQNCETILSLLVFDGSNCMCIKPGQIYKSQVVVCNIELCFITNKKFLQKWVWDCLPCKCTMTHNLPQLNLFESSFYTYNLGMSDSLSLTMSSPPNGSDQTEPLMRL